MGFIKELLEKNKRKISYEDHVCSEIHSINLLIGNIQTCNKMFSDNKKSHMPSQTNGFIWHLNLLSDSYDKFLLVLKSYQYQYDHASNANNKAELKQKLDYMLQKKKEYRAEFEGIYHNFNRITKGANFPRRNEILGLMRKAFDFDSSKYYGKNIVHEIQ